MAKYVVSRLKQKWNGFFLLRSSHFGPGPPVYYRPRPTGIYLINQTSILRIAQLLRQSEYTNYRNISLNLSGTFNS